MIWGHNSNEACDATVYSATKSLGGFRPSQATSMIMRPRSDLNDSAAMGGKNTRLKTNTLVIKHGRHAENQDRSPGNIQNCRDICAHLHKAIGKKDYRVIHDKLHLADIHHYSGTRAGHPNWSCHLSIQRSADSSHLRSTRSRGIIDPRHNHRCRCTLPAIPERCLHIPSTVSVALIILLAWHDANACSTHTESPSQSPSALHSKHCRTSSGEHALTSRPFRNKSTHRKSSGHISSSQPAPRKRPSSLPLLSKCRMHQ